ncbi:NAD(P)/FAD-dependent oxidoreductase [Pedococcus sp. 5OH_020]|uniref:NAD(P)/FAD-dependent oxidoreductase n=1 Tax=Pedococcus sp. 5OH_020 TaxID=2989814 RepID=UPI0022E9B697|nr:FAD-dependent oxidoreductase [Pedococcus sp. 5OH_020]
MSDVLVVGAGIIGASIAYHAARAGASVRVVDKSLPGSGVTADSFAWIGAAGDAPPSTEGIYRTVLEDYRRLETQLPRVRVRWTGSVTWSEAVPTDSGDLGPGQRLVDTAEIARLEPNLRTPPRWAVFTASDGAVDPVEVTEALVEAARGHGAQVALGVAVRGLRVQEGRVVGVDTSTGFVAAGTVVLAAGVDTPGLCAPLGLVLPVGPSPALLLRYAGPPGIIRTLLASPGLEARQTGDRELLVARPYRGETSRADLARTARETSERLRAMFEHGEELQPAGIRLGMRPMPSDEVPVIGPTAVAGVYVAVMHAGVTLAPTVGRLVAGELTDRADADELRRCRPGRLLRNSTVVT